MNGLKTQVYASLNICFLQLFTQLCVHSTTLVDICKLDLILLLTRGYAHDECTQTEYYISEL